MMVVEMLRTRWLLSPEPQKGFDPQLIHEYFYTVNHKKRDILFLTITLASLNRFL